MNIENHAKIRVGVWVPFGKGSHWAGEGIARTIEFILNGFANEPTIAKRFVFVFFVSTWTVSEIRRSLAANVDPELEIEIVALPNAGHWAGAIFDGRGRVARKTRRRLEWIEQFIRGERSAAFTVASGFLFLARGDHVQLESDITALREFRDLTGVDLSEATIEQRISLSGKKKKWDEAFDSNGRFPIDVQQFVQLRTQKTGGRGKLWLLPFAALSRFAQKGLRVVEALQMVRSAMRAAQDHAIDLWWIPSPTAPASSILRGRRVANFWDYVIAEYGYWWDKHTASSVLARARLAMHEADHIITQSKYNKNMHLVNSIGVHPEKIDVIRLGPPDYSRFIPGFSESKKRTEETKRLSADILRGYARAHLRMSRLAGSYGYTENGNQYDRLCNFDFSNKKYIVVSTQDRPYKNLGMIADVLSYLVHRRKIDVYMFLTAKVSLAADEAVGTSQTLPEHARSPRGVPGVVGRRIIEEGLQDRFFNMARVPNRVHAALYHCASATYHPSLTEGGVGSYPFMEGMTVGCPGFITDGEYAREGLTLHPRYMEIVVSSVDVEDVVAKIEAALSDSDKVAREQAEIFQAHADWSWQHVARAYANIFSKIASS